ncbi:putative effector protein [Ceratobasidium theobromae]|uniref:Putative effector protein n=1 Tax=Ceratobasidium theobromae TaxID=1582974 RepID=A0A5N5QLX9_9AGAM|nr:putative effector protein [Ceratobasidium theobromae]
MLFSVALLALSAALGLASPLDPRAAPDNTVLIRSATEYCMIMPRQPHTDIGQSESEGQMRSYCSASARSSNSQGLFPNNFWRKVTYKKTANYVQLTGCINKGFSQLNDNDGGGQYDSSGGAGSQGNPRGSKCEGYNHYVELVEPDVGRACIRCCQNPSDCPLTMDTAGCPAVISGTYGC